MPVSFASSSVSPAAGGVTPFQRIIEPQQLGMFLSLEQAEMNRIRRYSEHWRFYLGQQWNIAREADDPLVTLNYTRALTNKIVSWLVGNGITIKVPDVTRNHTLPVLAEVWKYNLVDQLLYGIATVGAVTGDVFILVTYMEPTAQARRINPNTQGSIRIQLLNSEQVYPVWHPLDTNVLTSVRIETVYTDSQPQVDNPDQAGRQLHTRRFTQVITADQVMEQYQGHEPSVKPNPLGEIPLVHIKNMLIPGEYYGLGEMDAIIDLNKEFNEKATDVSDIVNYHAAPITIIKGAKAKNVEKSARNIWSGLPKEAEVFNLELQGELGASIEYLRLIKTAMLEIAGVPEGSLGTMQPISNTSGVALHTQYQPLVEGTKRKRATYEPGLQDVCYFILRIKETIDPTFRLPTDLCKNCGGRIVEMMDEGTGKRWKRCFHVDPQTFELLPPDEMKVRAVRRMSFGDVVEEIPYKQVKAEFGKVSASYWDPQKERSIEDDAVDELERNQQLKDKQADISSTKVTPGANAGEGEGEGAASALSKAVAAPAPPPRVSADLPKLPTALLDLPPEPEQITIRKVQRDPSTGTDTLVEEESTILVVSTRCERHEYLNPYEVEVHLNDTVPKDKHLDAELFQLYDKNKWVSKRWIRKQIPEVDDPGAVEDEILDERSDASKGRDPSEVEAAAVKKRKDGNRDALSRTVGPPFGSNLPGG